MKGDDTIYLTYKTLLNATSSQTFEIIKFVSEHIIGIYNNINYDIRQYNIKTERYYYDKYKYHWRADYIEKNTFQQTIRLVVDDWLNYFRAKSSFEKYGNKYAKVKPNPPGYKKCHQPVEIIFVRSSIIIKCEKILLTISDATAQKFGRKLIEIRISDIWGRNYKTKEAEIREILKNIQQIRIVWKPDEENTNISIIYLQKEKKIETSNKNVMSIDLGINNLCALTFRYGIKSYIVNGKPLKSYNRYINNMIDCAQREKMKQIGSSSQYKDTQEIVKMRHNRENYINNYLHHVSKICIKMSLTEKCRVIVMGDLSGIKHEKHNRTFVQIPLLRLCKMIEYKAKIQGITVVYVDEAYTSVSSSVDLEEIKYLSNRINRRVYRGAFVWKPGQIMNSDINGSLNILRKFLDKAYSKRYMAIQKGIPVDMTGSIPELINFIRDKGYVVSPIKINVNSETILCTR